MMSKGYFSDLSNSGGIKSCNTCYWKKRSLLDKLLTYIGVGKYLRTTRKDRCLRVTPERNGSESDRCFLQTLYRPIFDLYPHRCSKELLNWEPYNDEERFIYRLKHKINTNEIKKKD